MKILAALAIVVALIGCSGQDRAANKDPMLETSGPAKDANATTEPERMPGGVGITAGQTGTGTTSGSSTGY